METFKKKIYNIVPYSKLEELVHEHIARFDVFPKMRNWNFQESEEAANDTEYAYDDVGRSGSKEYPELSEWDLHELVHGTAGARIVLVWLVQARVIHIGNYLILLSY